MALNMRQRSYRYKDTVLPQHLVEKHRRWDMTDYILYDHFTSVFFRKISSEEDFWDEVYLYKLLKSRAESFCDNVAKKVQTNLTREVYSFARRDYSLDLDPRPWGQPFKIRAIDCLIRQLDTRVHRNIFKVRQYPELCTSPNITRKWVPDTGLFDIKWDQSTLHIDKIYCQPIDPAYDVPLKVLTRPKMYMWKF